MRLVLIDILAECLTNMAIARKIWRICIVEDTNNV
jgi:hypothetical protein